MVAPSQKTAMAWASGYTRHVIRMECVICAVTFIGFIFAIAIGALATKNINDQLSYDAQNPPDTYTVNGYSYRSYYYDDDELRYERSIVWARVIVAPIITLAVSVLNLVLYYKVCLHPVYTLVLSIFFMLGWIVTFIFNLGFSFILSYGVDTDDAGPIAVAIIMEVCFGILMCAYFSYMVISAVGVDYARKAKKAGVLPGEAKMGVVAGAPAASHVPGPQTTDAPPA